MTYFLSTILQTSYADAVIKTKEALQLEGFGVLTEIDIPQTLKNKLNVEFRDYVILGACNPPFAHRALQIERHVGLLLPCNVVVQDAGNGNIEVSAIDPVVAMQGTQNEVLAGIAAEVREKLRRVIASL